MPGCRNGPRKPNIPMTNQPYFVLPIAVKQTKPARTEIIASFSYDIPQTFLLINCAIDLRHIFRTQPPSFVPQSKPKLLFPPRKTGSGPSQIQRPDEVHRLKNRPEDPILYYQGDPLTSFAVI